MIILIIFALKVNMSISLVEKSNVVPMVNCMGQIFLCNWSVSNWDWIERRKGEKTKRNMAFSHFRQAGKCSIAPGSAIVLRRAWVRGSVYHAILRIFLVFSFPLAARINLNFEKVQGWVAQKPTSTNSGLKDNLLFYKIC